MNDAVFLTEAGFDYGFGHLTRCMAIAEGFKENNISSTFYLRGRLNKDFSLFDFSWRHSDWLKEEINVSGKIVILDSYYADIKYCQHIYERAEKILFIDDNNRIPYPGGFVVNSIMGAETLGYPDNRKVTYLLGSEFHPLRKEFWAVPEKIINQEIIKILITFGGSDITNETPTILRRIIKKYPDLEKRVIIGRGYSNIDEIKKVSDNKTVLIYYPEAKIMKEEMFLCDLAISAAGQTIYELARIGVPTHAIQVAENQANILLNWGKSNFLLTESIFTTLPDVYTRKSVSDIGRILVDGKGVVRIIKRLVSDNC